MTTTMTATAAGHRSVQLGLHPRNPRRRLAAPMRLTRPDIVLWLTWVVAATLGNMTTAVAELRAFGVPFGYPLGSIGSEVSLVLAGSVGVAIFQFVVLRAVIRAPTLPAIMWVALTVPASVGEYVATYMAMQSISLRGLLSPAAIQLAMLFAFEVIAGFLLGAVLWAILGVRSALFVWPAAGVIPLALSYAILMWGPALRVLNGLQTLPEVLIGDALGGALYGIVTGVALTALTHRSRRALPTSAAGHS